MNAPGPLANGLYPIVRRVRRPLIPVDESVPEGAPVVVVDEPAAAVPLVAPEAVKVKSKVQGKSNDGSAKN